MSGGPGASSLYASVHEIGPCSIKSQDDLVWRPGSDVKSLLQPNPHSWMANATLLFVDQPIGTGWSYHSNQTMTTANTLEAASDMRHLLQSLFSNFPQYKHLDLHIAGESYAGVYIPFIAEELLKNGPGINLNSIAVGNGDFNQELQTQYFADWGAAIGLWNSSIATEMNRFKDDCAHDAAICSAKNVTCILSFSSCVRFNEMNHLPRNMNPYDVRTQKMAHGVLPDSGYLESIDLLFQDPKVQALMEGEVPFKTLTNLLSFDDSALENSSNVVKRLLENGVRVLIYAGEYDSVCTFTGQIAWMESISSGFKTSQQRNWTSAITSQKAGEWRMFEQFAFVRVYNAGHMVPFFQPEHSLEMIQEWLHGSPRKTLFV